MAVNTQETRSVQHGSQWSSRVQLCKQKLKFEYQYGFSPQGRAELKEVGKSLPIQELDKAHPKPLWLCSVHPTTWNGKTWHNKSNASIESAFNGRRQQICHHILPSLWGVGLCRGSASMARKSLYITYFKRHVVSSGGAGASRSQKAVDQGRAPLQMLPIPYPRSTSIPSAALRDRVLRQTGSCAPQMVFLSWSFCRVQNLAFLITQWGVLQELFLKLQLTLPSQRTPRAKRCTRRCLSASLCSCCSHGLVQWQSSKIR